MKHLQLSITDFRHCIPDFVLPSCSGLKRYLNAYFECFHPHLPFIHSPTLQLSTCSIELILAICAAGAQFVFEFNKSQELFYAANRILFERRQIRERQRTEEARNERSTRPSTASQPLSCNTANSVDGQAQASLDELQCLLCLVVISVWKSDRNLNRTSSELQSSLVYCIRKDGLEETDSHVYSSQWRYWAFHESKRRVKTLAFCYVNLQNVAYNIPPVLLGHELQLRLPSSTEEWETQTEDEWKVRKRQFADVHTTFSQALSHLCASNGDVIINPTPSALGKYALLHGLMQRIFLIQQASLAAPSALLEDDNIRKIG